ncbi:putative protein phosphatase methylesterase 1 [Gregarina niphandrodes]|uniref:protein phosphatase methylesterase-1 n=1 Tax=Gregarina niphandrodes TaxID=110365 RepID=A0A023BDX7_GRENI|nr:putative protein phosphatase methylesterase 1 [Gregarina niphandrodes]EZG89735.1 putative protein phosphatase methylesterase 1 [Gregarina niphandrodes]|eukprot:XP_011128443.1 putative protein phosphatase methylesterase 1 [Gregarina niphandrodes]
MLPPAPRFWAARSAEIDPKMNLSLDEDTVQVNDLSIHYYSVQKENTPPGASVTDAIDPLVIPVCNSGPSGAAGKCYDDIAILIHGAGHCGMSYALLADLLRSHFTVVAPDLRGHGKTWRGIDEDLSVETLVDDLVCFVKTYLVMKGKSTSRVLLVGHSMGGAVVVKAARELLDQKILHCLRFFTKPPTQDDTNPEGTSQKSSMSSKTAVSPVNYLNGVVLLDVCEEVALAALPSSKRFAEMIPAEFASEQEAIEWTSHHLVRNHTSATLSTPPQLYRDHDCFRWKVKLLNTQRWWPGWFQNMDKILMQLPCPTKVVIVAGIDNIGNDIVVAQMSGKLQLEVIPKSGHIIHEDQAKEVAEKLISLLLRQHKMESVVLSH